MLDMWGLDVGPNPETLNALCSWVMDLEQIRRRYLRTWFPADLVAATPYDVLAVIFHDHWLGKLQFLRLLRLAKLARVMRVQRFFRRWESWLSINYRYV